MNGFPLSSPALLGIRAVSSQPSWALRKTPRWHGTVTRLHRAFSLCVLAIWILLTAFVLLRAFYWTVASRSGEQAALTARRCLSLECSEKSECIAIDDRVTVCDQRAVEHWSINRENSP